MERLLGLALGILICASASANAEGLKAPPCEQSARTQPEITACAVAAARAADQHLNNAYRDLLRYLDPEETKNLLAAQRKWVAFRDADCAFWGAGDFSLAPTNKAYCVADVSERRAKELESWPPNSDRSAVVPYRPKR